MTNDPNPVELRETELDQANGGFVGDDHEFSVKAPKGQRPSPNRSGWTDFQEHPD